jgi:flagellar hook-basal body complex protein FliE
MVAPLIAAKAYAAAQGMGGAGLAGAVSPTAGPDFGHLVNQAMTDAVSDSRSAESQITAHMQGKTNLIDVVDAISSAQTSLNTMIAVRNQMIQSYQQIMSMTI